VTPKRYQATRSACPANIPPPLATRSTRRPAVPASDPDLSPGARQGGQLVYLPRASNPGKCAKAAGPGGIRPGYRMPKSFSASSPLPLKTEPRPLAAWATHLVATSHPVPVYSLPWWEVAPGTALRELARVLAGSSCRSFRSL
jgi:hypothetical protein